MRVEYFNLVEWDVEHIRYLAKVNALSHRHGVDDERFLGESGVDVVLLVIGHHIVCSDESWHISSSLSWQVVVYFPEVGVLGACTSNCLVHVTWSAVVGCDG